MHLKLHRYCLESCLIMPIYIYSAIHKNDVLVNYVVFSKNGHISTIYTTYNQSLYSRTVDFFIYIQAAV